MVKKTANNKKSIYQLTREALDLSRADATRFVPGRKEYPGMDGITENVLVKLENGDRAIRPEDVVAMAKRYNKPELRNYYCCNECAIGKIDAPEVTYSTGIHEILINMAVSLESINNNKIRFMEILQDEKLDSDEVEDYQKIYEELEKISMTIEALQLWCEKKKFNNK